MSLRTAVVLGAGGLVGQAYHLGVLTALAEVADVDARSAHVVVGTSAGSLVAAGLTAGLSAGDMAAELLGEPVSAEGAALRAASRHRSAVRRPHETPLPRGRRPLAPSVLAAAARRPWRARPAALASGLAPAGRIPSDTISRAVGRLHGDDWPDALRVCALRARDGRRVVFGSPRAPRVDVGTAVAASCAVPGYFSPVRAHGETYVDGGGHSPSNADIVRHEHPDVVLVVSPMSMGRGTVLQPRADLAVRLAVRRYLGAEVRQLRRSGAEVVVLQPGPADLAAMGLNPMLGARAQDVVRTAAASTRARLEAQPRLVGLLGEALPLR